MEEPQPPCFAGQSGTTKKTTAPRNFRGAVVSRTHLCSLRRPPMWAYAVSRLQTSGPWIQSKTPTCRRDGSLKSFRTIGPILALACGLRLVLFLAVAPHPERFFTPDSPQYVFLGSNFQEAYAARSGELLDRALLHTPGYPLLIHGIYAMVGEQPWAVILVQVAFSVLTVWLTYVVGLGLFGPRAAWFASLALAMDPISIIMANYLQPEVFFTFMLVAGSICWSQAIVHRSPWWSGGAGVLVGDHRLEVRVEEAGADDRKKLLDRHPVPAAEVGAGTDSKIDAKLRP